MPYRKHLMVLNKMFWGMKEPTYIMIMMATGVRLLADETCKETVLRWKEHGEDGVKKFK